MGEEDGLDVVVLIVSMFDWTTLFGWFFVSIFGVEA